MSDTGIPEGRSPGSLAWAGLPFAGYDGLRGMFKATMPACAAICDLQEPLIVVLQFL